MSKKYENDPSDQFGLFSSDNCNCKHLRDFWKPHPIYARSDNHDPPPPLFPPFFGFRKKHGFFGIAGHRGPPPMGSPLPFTRKSFRNLKNFFILTILADNPEGITGYQIQDKYKIPRSNVTRILDKLEKEGYAKTEESVVEGRAQKRYQLTTEGKKFLDELKEKWAMQFAFFSELAPPERFGDPFIRPGLYQRMIDDIEELKSPEDALDYFQGYRSYIKRRLSRFEKRFNRLSSVKADLDNIIKEISTWDELKIDELKNILDKIKTKSEIE